MNLLKQIHISTLEFEFLTECSDSFQWEIQKDWRRPTEPHPLDSEEVLSECELTSLPFLAYSALYEILFGFNWLSHFIGALRIRSMSCFPYWTVMYLYLFYKMVVKVLHTLAGWAKVLNLYFIYIYNFFSSSLPCSLYILKLSQVH
jgi:hypothetical protein